MEGLPGRGALDCRHIVRRPLRRADCTHSLHVDQSRGQSDRERRRISLTDPGREIGPDEFEQQAALAETNRDYIGAVRLLFRAALRRLEIFEKKKFRPGITNREVGAPLSIDARSPIRSCDSSTRST